MNLDKIFSHKNFLELSRNFGRFYRNAGCLKTIYSQFITDYLIFLHVQQLSLQLQVYLMLLLFFYRT